MPHRSMASIIQFYYNTKKDTDYKSLFDSRMADDSDEEEGCVPANISMIFGHSTILS